MQHWKRLHSNGWTTEVKLLPDGGYSFRTFKSNLVPADFSTDPVRRLPLAQAMADSRVPNHACACPAWEEW